MADKKIEKWTIWLNLKSVVGIGGSQTRTLRDECYHFVHAQLHYLLKITQQTHRRHYLFANIFDGDEAAAKMRMFVFLLDQECFASIKKYIYVGSYFPWLRTTLVDFLLNGK
jgi:hypothetical protein